MTDVLQSAASAPGWTIEAIEGKCRVLRNTLQARRVSDPELDALAPGGAENQTTDPLGATVVWYAHLRARFAVEQLKEADADARAQADVGAALAGDGVPVRLSPVDAPSSVFPKSYHALRFCDALDHALRRVVATAQTLEELEVQALAPLTESLTVRLWAWILTHPGPALPFEDDTHAEPPAWTHALTPDDLLALLAAHMEANGARIARIARLFPSGEAATETRLTLAGFLGTVAQELGHRPFDVLRHWSVGEAFAQAAVTAQAAREAKERADADAAARKAS